MIFLIEYSRREGGIVTFRKFEDAQLQEAADTRLEIELDINRKGIDHEVVLFDAESEEALRRTHRRYFETLRQMVEPSRFWGISVRPEPVEGRTDIGGGSEALDGS